MEQYYEVLELFKYDLDTTAYVISHHSEIKDKNKILKKLEKYEVKEFLDIFNVILENKDDALMRANMIDFKSEVDYIRYLKDKLILNDVLFANWEKKKVVRNKSQVIKKSKPKSKKRVIKKVLCSKNLLDFMEQKMKMNIKMRVTPEQKLKSVIEYLESKVK